MLRRMALKLYGHDTSPYVRRVRILLAEKGLEFTRDADSWSTPNAEITRLNPMLRVPALVDDAVKSANGAPQQLLDSKTIAAYLYDRYPQVAAAPAGRPALQGSMFHPAHRYDDENTLLAIDTGLDSAINLFLLELDGVPRESSPYLQRQAERLRRCLGFIDERLAGRTTLHDGSFGFVDIAITCALDWFVFRKRYPVHEHANLVRFLDAHRERPAIAATHPSLAQNAAPPKTPAAK